MTSGPLSGIRVLDITHVLAGPYATYQLALLGAEVIKVERPGIGDVMRHAHRGTTPAGFAPGFVAMNAGKRSLALDLGRPEGIALLRRLAGEVDVVIENLRPGAMAKKGLDAATLTAANPRLVHCSVSGWGNERPAYDHVIQAATGMMLVNGDDPAAPPMKMGGPIVDIATGQSTAFAILAALMQRAQTGRGTAITVSMVDAALQLMFSAASGWLLARQAPQRVGNRGFAGSPASDTFATADGWIATGANTRAQFERLARAIGRADLIDDPRFATPPGRAAGFMSAGNEALLRQELAATFATADAEVWEARLNQAGVPAAKVRGIGEFLDTIYPNLGPALVDLPAMPGYPPAPKGLGLPMKGPDFAPQPAPPPALGQDSRAILEGMGMGAAEIDTLVASGVVGVAPDLVAG
jgi:crotonobetainyl-CoA:carnitine CoA-transferase CaiB-like acyl-CoA transferase